VRKLSEYVREKEWHPSLCKFGDRHVSEQDWARALRRAVLDGVTLSYQKQKVIGQLIELGAASWGNDAMSMAEKIVEFDVETCKICDGCSFALPDCPTCKTREGMVVTGKSEIMMSPNAWHCGKCGADIVQETIKTEGNRLEYKYVIKK